MDVEYVRDNINTDGVWLLSIRLLLPSSVAVGEEGGMGMRGSRLDPLPECLNEWARNTVEYVRSCTLVAILGLYDIACGCSVLRGLRASCPPLRLDDLANKYHSIGTRRP